MTPEYLGEYIKYGVGALLNRYRLAFSIVMAGLFLGILGCVGTTSSDDPVQVGGHDEDAQAPFLGTLTLDNAQDISRQATKSVVEVLSMHRYVLAYQGLLPWSEIRHAICVEGDAGLVDGVKSPVNDPQGNEIVGSKYDFDSCRKPGDQIFQGKLGIYWNSESTVYVLELEDFAAYNVNTTAPRIASGVFVFLVDEAAAFQSEISSLVRESGAEESLIRFDATLVYQNDGLKKLQWGGRLSLAGHGEFELRQSDGEPSRSVISDGESLLYIDFSAMSGNIIEASLDLGADGALDAVWPINLNDLNDEGAEVVLLEKLAAG